jgi:hypothetical protein
MRVLMCGLLGLAVLTGCGGAPTPAAGNGGATVDKNGRPSSPPA